MYIKCTDFKKLYALVEVQAQGGFADYGFYAVL
jgi:hypothetical protein